MTQPIGPRTLAGTKDEDPDVPASFQPFSPRVCFEEPRACPPPIPKSLARAAEFLATVQPLPSARVQASLDRFMASTEGPYHTPDGPRFVTPPFRMALAYEDQARTLRDKAPLVERARLEAGMSPADVHAVETGRGTPEQVRALTQALINVSGPGPWSPITIRNLMNDSGIGFDCAGYTQQAYLSMRGETRAQAGFKTLDDEDLSDLGKRGFTLVPDVEHVRPGDILVLGPPSPKEVGHRAIVYESRLANADEIQALYATGDKATEFSRRLPIYVLQLDSSWGSDGKARVGGVQRNTFLYSGFTGQWARYAPPLYGDPNGSPIFVATSGPYDHPLEGFYRGPVPAGRQP